MTPDEPIRRLVIIGGGSAGWMAAAALSTALSDRLLEIHLVESSDIGIVGVGEATIPPILHMNRRLGVDENDFIARTEATFKVGIEFEGWSGPGSRYLHPFGPYGSTIGPVAFPHYWRRLRAQIGDEAGTLDDYSLTACAARSGRFQRVVQEPGVPPQYLTYAFHFDANLYARFLQERAQAQGVIRHDRRIVGHKLADNGFLEAVILENGETLAADFFIDCSGFRGLLIGEALGVPFEDWSDWLPCDRAIAVPSAPLEDLPPFTRATAREAGWQWRIPLQHRTGNGHVYCSRFMSDDEATALLLQNLSTQATGEPRLLKFRTGHRRLFWHKNVVSIGLSSGFLEPLESTSIHFIQTAIEKLLNLFPDRSFRQADIDFYNKETAREFESVRDFLILHYWANGRGDQPFWCERKERGVPPRLQERIDLYRGYGRVFPDGADVFSPVSWTAVFEGQGIGAAAPDPMTSGFPPDQLKNKLDRIRTAVERWTEAMPPHARFVDACRAEGEREPQDRLRPRLRP